MLKVNIQSIDTLLNYNINKGDVIEVKGIEEPKNAFLEIYLSDENEITITLNPWKFKTEEIIEDKS